MNIPDNLTVSSEKTIFQGIAMSDGNKVNIDTSSVYIDKITDTEQDKVDIAEAKKRVMTPAEAKKIGSDYIVVGRPITAAEDPVAAYKRCVAEFVD